MLLCADLLEVAGVAIKFKLCDSPLCYVHVLLKRTERERQKPVNRPFQSLINLVSCCCHTFSLIKTKVALKSLPNYNMTALVLSFWKIVLCLFACLEGIKTDFMFKP